MTEPHAPQEGTTSSPHAHASGSTTEGHAAHHEGGRAVPFTAEDWQEFHENDAGAGKVIVLLMTGIFLTGLALYTVVAIAASS
jgi:hypothetical protein